MESFNVVVHVSCHKLLPFLSSQWRQPLQACRPWSWLKHAKINGFEGPIRGAAIFEDVFPVLDGAMTFYV